MVLSFNIPPDLTHLPSFSVSINFLAAWKTGRAGSSTDVEQSQSLVNRCRIKGMTKWNITSKFWAGIIRNLWCLSIFLIGHIIFWFPNESHTSYGRFCIPDIHNTHLGHGHLLLQRRNMRSRGFQMYQKSFGWKTTVPAALQWCRILASQTPAAGSKAWQPKETGEQARRRQSAPSEYPRRGEEEWCRCIVKELKLQLPACVNIQNKKIYIYMYIWMYRQIPFASVGWLGTTTSTEESLESLGCSCMCAWRWPAWTTQWLAWRTSTSTWRFGWVAYLEKWCEEGWQRSPRMSPVSETLQVQGSMVSTCFSSTSESDKCQGGGARSHLLSLPQGLCPTQQIGEPSSVFYSVRRGDQATRTDGWSTTFCWQPMWAEGFLEGLGASSPCWGTCFASGGSTRSGFVDWPQRSWQCRPLWTDLRCHWGVCCAPQWHRSCCYFTVGGFSTECGSSRRDSWNFAIVHWYVQAWFRSGWRWELRTRPTVWWRAFCGLQEVELGVADQSFGQRTWNYSFRTWRVGCDWRVHQTYSDTCHCPTGPKTDQVGVPHFAPPLFWSQKTQRCPRVIRTIRGSCSVS